MEGYDDPTSTRAEASPKGGEKLWQVGIKELVTRSFTKKVDILNVLGKRSRRRIQPWRGRTEGAGRRKRERERRRERKRGVG
jgi:hypothetical protein